VHHSVRVSDEPSTSRTMSNDERSYLCRLTANPEPTPNEVRVKAVSYEDAIRKAIRAFREDPEFTPPEVRVTMHAYMMTSTGIHDEDAAFRFIRPEDWR